MEPLRRESPLTWSAPVIAVTIRQPPRGWRLLRRITGVEVSMSRGSWSKANGDTEDE